MIIAFELKVSKRSDAFQNYPKSKGYLPKTSAAAFTIQKVEKGALNISLDLSLLKILLLSSNQDEQYKSYNDMTILKSKLNLTAQK